MHFRISEVNYQSENIFKLRVHAYAYFGWGSTNLIEISCTRISKARHGNFLTLNLHDNINNVIAKKMSYLVFIIY